MPKLVATRGWSASGKTYWAEKWVQADPEHRVNVNRDDLRASLFGSEGVLSHENEQIITQVQQATVTAAFKRGHDVVLSDTNLRAKFLREWADLVADLGGEFEVKDFHVDLDTCLARNRDRADRGGRFVPEEAIYNQAKRFPFPWKEVKARPNIKLSVQPYTEEEQAGLPTVVLCDIDGTIADMTRNGRNPFDLKRVKEDDPIKKVIDVVNALGREHRIIFLSGRDSVCRSDTIEWLEKHVRPEVELYMRPEGDNRTDFIIKHELFEAHIRGKYDVVACFDDRPQVARLWRALELPLFQVGAGDSVQF